MFRYLTPIWKQGIIWMLCVSALASDQGQSLVLCVGEDGHVEIEMAKDGSCNSCFLEDDHASEFAKADNHCGSCVDVALVSSGSREADQQRHRLGKPKPMVIQTQYPQIDERKQERHDCIAPVLPVRDATLTGIRSIRLII